MLRRVDAVQIEVRRTLTFAAAGLGLAVLAWVTTPRRVTPAVLQEQGQSFFPNFVDPNAASSLEVVDYDAQMMMPRPFKVLNRDGRWTIPSHDNYPADASDRLSSIAASIIALKKDDVASDELGDQERCGVLDPQNDTLPAAQGRGTRITVRGKNDSILADIIIGKTIEGRPNFRYVRLPDQKRTYVARVDHLDISTRFEDWIERNLLQVNREDIDQIIIRNYSTDSKSGAVTLREMLVLRKRARDVWTLDGVKPPDALDTYRMNLLVTELANVVVVDVRPKPPGVTATLTAASAARGFLPADVAELAGKGFYFSADGQLLSNQGEVVVHTSSGIFYVLRFGEVAYAPRDSRYLFISMGLDTNADPGAAAADDRKRLAVLRARFAPWYYLVSNDDFKKIRLGRSDLVSRPKRTPGP